ncbi:hypothetical protein CRENPOLYSF2_980009 [Crenothrix polyspora]|uniref:Uncharacterized protein n=1 Tax=Crenothrix polyspora TaxID=360316 RepID=A0A1R4HJB5_9GAMM|nr:hypothetical protein CRENPOLYSF2_980009 [Crenothrix polyspora]
MRLVGFSKKNIYQENILKPCHATMYILNALLERFTEITGKKTGAILQRSSKIGIIVYRKKPVPLFACTQRTQRETPMSYQHYSLSIG